MSPRIARPGRAPPPGRSGPVILIRSVPDDVTSDDLKAWASSFDYTTSRGNRCTTSCKRAVVAPEKGIGFVQLDSADMARAIMGVYETSPADVYLEKDGTRHPLNLLASSKTEIQMQPDNCTPCAHEDGDKAGRVLLVVLGGLTDPITLSEIFWKFGQFGVVEKLSTFLRASKNQVLVQFRTAAEADLAMEYMNGKDIVFLTQHGPVGCKLSIVPSKFQHLQFKSQDKRNRDYTQENALLRGDWRAWVEARGGADEECMATVRQLEALTLPERVRQIKQNWPQSRFYAGCTDFLWATDLTAAGCGRLVPEQNCPSQFGTIPRAQQVDGEGIPAGRVGDCVHVSHLSSLTKEVELWRLFGAFGEVKAVRRLYRHPDKALVQYAHASHAARAIESLDGLLWGAVDMRHPLVVAKGKNPNAMHWSGAGTDLERRMITVKGGAVPPPRHPSHTPGAPGRYILFWSATAGGFAGNMAEVFYDIITHDLPLARRGLVTSSPAVVPAPRWGDAVHPAYVARLPSTEAAVAVVAAVNGEDPTHFVAMQAWAVRNARSLDGLHVGVTFVTQAQAEQVFNDNDRVSAEEGEGFLGEDSSEGEGGLMADHSETCAMVRSVDHILPHSKTAPATPVFCGDHATRFL